jgi:hypothetical protein
MFLIYLLNGTFLAQYLTPCVLCRYDIWVKAVGVMGGEEGEESAEVV